MATITGLTADRMKAIEDASVVDGSVDANGELILTTHGGSTIDAGHVVGPQGIQGDPGINGAGHIICTSTTRPALLPADEGKTIYETDTDLVRTWDGYIWHLQERIICSSTTRPAGLTGGDQGVKIYEVDTGLEFTWNGSSWIPPNPSPLGIIAQGIAVNTPAANQILNVSTVLAGKASWLANHVITLPVDAGGLYSVSLTIQYRSDNVVLMGANVRSGTGVALPTPDGEMGIADSHYLSSANVMHTASWLRSFAGGQTFSIRNLGNPPASPGFNRVIRFSLLKVADALAS
jgi:hypothetical protein